MDDILETKYFDESTGVMHTRHTYDNSSVLKDNIESKKEAHDLGMGRYRSRNSQLVKVGSIHMGDVIRLQSLGYNLLATDPDERRRALVYIQENESHLLSVPGKPFTTKKKVWA